MYPQLVPPEAGLPELHHCVALVHLCNDTKLPKAFYDGAYVNRYEAANLPVKNVPIADMQQVTISPCQRRTKSVV